MCRRLKVSRAGFYRYLARQHRPPTLQQVRRAQVTQAVITTFAESKGRLGRRPMRQCLAEQQLPCSPGLVHRIMAEQGLHARRNRAWNRTTIADPAARVAHIPNHCRDAQGRRDFSSPIPGLRTVGDVTFIPTAHGWRYLAVVLDLATRAVIGWAIGPDHTTALVVRALTMAKAHGRLLPGAIFHSDRGSQYTAAAFQTACAELGVVQSLGATGVCWDNAVAEAFFATLKADLTELGAGPPAETLRQWLVLWIEGWDNRRRPHSFNQGRPPLMAWALHQSPSPPVSPS